MIEGIKNYIIDKNYKIIIYNNKINIVNYKKINFINEKEVSISLELKKIIIKGNNLKLKKMIDDEILINGDVKNIEVKNEE